MAFVTTPVGTTLHQEGNFGALLEPKLRKVFYQTYQEVPEQYSKIFHTKTSTKAQETDFHIGAFSTWSNFGKKLGEAGYPYTSGNVDGIQYATINPGAQIVYTHAEFAQGFLVERKFVDDEMYGVIEKMAADLARAGRNKVETDAADFINGMFSTSKVKLLASTTNAEPIIFTKHSLINSASYCSNQVKDNPVLSGTSLKEAMMLSRKQVDQAGKLINMNFDKLVVSPADEFTARELMNSTLIPGSTGATRNDTNVLKGAFDIVVLDRLTTGSWFIMDSNRHELNFFWRVKPEFKREEDFDSLVSKYRGYMRYSMGASDFRGIIGSLGDASDTDAQVAIV